MEWIILSVIIVSISIGIYKLGEKQGIEKVNNVQIDVGTWVKVIKPVKHKSVFLKNPEKVPSGVEGIVTNTKIPDNIILVGKYIAGKEISIFVASPWLESFERSKFMGINEFGKLRIIPESQVSKDVKKTTLEALYEYEEEYKAIFSSNN